MLSCNFKEEIVLLRLEAESKRYRRDGLQTKSRKGMGLVPFIILRFARNSTVMAARTVWRKRGKEQMNAGERPCVNCGGS